MTTRPVAGCRCRSILSGWAATSSMPFRSEESSQIPSKLIREPPVPTWTQTVDSRHLCLASHECESSITKFRRKNRSHGTKEGVDG
jgi:hypothetical protein